MLAHELVPGFTGADLRRRENLDFALVAVVAVLCSSVSALGVSTAFANVAPSMSARAVLSLF